MSEAPLLNIFNRLAGRDPKKRFKILWTLVFIAILGSTYYLGQNIHKNKSITQTKKDALSGDISKIVHMNLTEQNQAIKTKELQGNIQEAIKAFIQKDQVSGVISQISNLANNYNVSLIKINSGTSQPDEHYKEYTHIPIQAQISGEYINIGEYLGALEREIQFMFTWEKIVLRGGRVPDGIINVNARMDFYSRGD